MEKEIEINTTAYRRRNLYMEKKMHIDGMILSIILDTFYSNRMNKCKLNAHYI